MKFFTLINPDTNIDFMSWRKKAFILSAVLMVVSFGLLFARGFNYGIEFAGGSSAIVAFEKDSITDRDAIASSIEKVLVEKLNLTDSDVSVQDFGAGTGDTLNGREVNRFLIYTQATSTVDTAKRDAIVKALEARFADKGGVKIASSEDAGDVLYLNFGEDRAITETKAALNSLLKEQGFEKVTVTADYERQVEIEFLRDRDLQQVDAGTGKVDSLTALSDLDKQRRLEAAVEGKSDRRYTIEIEALQLVFSQQLAADFAGKFIEVESAAMVSPSVGANLFADGMLALLYSLVGILLYVALRFDFVFSPGGVIALLHDAMIVVGFIIIADIKFSLTVLAAILTVIGYSINDTIVIFDRVRELADSYKNRPLVDLLNRALNDTLSRTLLTSTTSFITLLSILFFGGAQVRDFALCMLVGIISGVYSTIYIAVPLVLYLDGYVKRKEADKAEVNKVQAKPAT